MELKFNLYCLYDKVSDTVVDTFIAQSDGVAVRNTLLTLRVPIRDSEIYQIGTMSRFLDNEKINGFVPSTDFEVVTPRLVDWESYKFPENIAEAVAPLGCTPDEIREITKNKIKEDK